MTTRQDAIEVLERGQAAIRRLLRQVPPHWAARPGIGGGDWSPKDLVGLLTTPQAIVSDPKWEMKPLI